MRPTQEVRVYSLQTTCQQPRVANPNTVEREKVEVLALHHSSHHSSAAVVTTAALCGGGFQHVASQQTCTTAYKTQVEIALSATVRQEPATK